MGKQITIKDATELWVSKMNAIPHALIEKAYPHMESDGLDELTPIPTKWECDTCSEEFSQEEVDELEAKEHVNDNDNIICPSCFKKEKLEFEADVEDEEYSLNECSSYIEEIEDEDSHEYGLPMWGWLWNPSSSDENWIRDNLKTVAECGFKIYESEEIGILIGIDGAGYDFYEQHWIPLYKASGLRWHNTEE